MEFDQRSVNEALIIKSALFRLGLDRMLFTNSHDEDLNSNHYREISLLLFNLVHIDTNFGNVQLPAFPPSQSRVYSYNQQIKTIKQLRGDDNPLIEVALEKYSMDLQFRAELYAMYSTFVLPNLKDLS